MLLIKLHIVHARRPADDQPHPNRFRSELRSFECGGERLHTPAASAIQDVLSWKDRISD